MNVAFEYGRAKVRDLRVSGERTLPQGKIAVEGIEIGGEVVGPTRRFWQSLFVRYKISDSVFRYFEPREVFERISRQAPDDRFRYCIERPKSGPARLLGISRPEGPLVTHGEIEDLAESHRGQHLAYDTGIVTSTHTPRSGERTIEIGGDQFRHQFVMETPIDGFGQPRTFLSLLRLVCSNGAVGYARAFRSDISPGKDLLYCIGRALDTYDNGNGYAALRQRFESAQHSWASLRECRELHKTLVSLRESKQLTKNGLLGDLDRLGGNLSEIYGLANLDALSSKRQRVLPARCRVYDLLNFASEAATHYATAAGRLALQAHLGGLISDEYDLEGTADSATEFTDLFVSADGPAPPISLN